MPNVEDHPDAELPVHGSIITPDGHVADTSSSDAAEAETKVDMSEVLSDIGQQERATSETEDTSDPDMPKKRRFSFKFSWPPTKRQQIIGGIAAVLIAFGIGAAWTHFHRTPPAQADVVKKKVVKKKPVITTVPSTLTGLPVDPSVNNRPVTAIMIENSPDARPQSGIDQAGVVFEALAEGGVTRFMGLYQDTQPDYIGPVRSARPYYIQWALGFDAGYAHVGGSPDGLADIKAWNVRDLDQFYNSGAYHRISSRYAPHNMYTSISALNQVEQSKGYNSSNFTGFARKADNPYKAPAAGTTTTNQDSRTAASSIDMNFSGFYYNSHYDYDAATNTYKRSESGAPHMEVDSSGKQTQIAPKVVIAMVVPLNQGALDSSGAYYSNYNPIGSGQVYVFQDGTVTTGTWNKADNTSQLNFTDQNGQPLKLNAGQTWIAAVASSSDVSYK